MLAIAQRKGVEGFQVQFRTKSVVHSGWRWILAGLAPLLVAEPALADSEGLEDRGSQRSDPEPDHTERTPARKSDNGWSGCPNANTGLALGASLVPGVLLHGAGHYVHGCKGLGERLLWLELSGIGLVLVALAPAPIFGGNAALVPFQAFIAMSGVALFGGSWLLDIYGTAVPEPSRGQPLNRAPSMETLAGYRYVYDPIFSFRHFFTQGFDIWQGPVRLMPRADFAIAGRNARYRVPAAFRLLGPTPDHVTGLGTFLDLMLGLTHHDFFVEGFEASTLELAAQSRLDLVSLDPGLRGTFAELGAGAGLTRYAYEAPGAGHDLNTLLLMSFAFGSYFGDPTGRGGEVKLTYDHRHDDFAAGSKLPGLGSGTIGHFGLEARGYLDSEFGALLDFQAGSAYVLGLSLLYRQAGASEGGGRGD